MARNVHNISKKQWAKFGKIGQAMFNRLWTQISFEPNWNSEAKKNHNGISILRHNACFLAACITKELKEDCI